MDAAEVIVLISGVLLIALTLWFFFGGPRDEIRPDVAAGPLYECPMHPWITSSDPAANCSICGMKLVKRD